MITREGCAILALFFIENSSIGDSHSGEYFIILFVYKLPQILIHIEFSYTICHAVKADLNKSSLFRQITLFFLKLKIIQ